MHLGLYCEQRSAAAGTERFEAVIILSAISYKYLTEEEEEEGERRGGGREREGDAVRNKRKGTEEDRQGWRAVF